MRKLLFIFLFFPVLSFGQKADDTFQKPIFFPYGISTIKITYPDGTVQNSAGGTNSNPLGYFFAAVVSDDDREDQTAINAAILTAHNAVGGGTVYIPHGHYDLTGPITMRPYVRVLCDSWGTAFEIPSTYTGNILIGETTGLTGASWIGGRFHSYGYGWNFINLKSDATGPIVYNFFEDIKVGLCKIAINMVTENDGWINANFFHNIVIDGAIEFLKTREGVGSSGIDFNTFSNISVQSSPNTTFGIDSLSGSWNQFNNFMLWDFMQAPNATTCVLASTSSYNYIQGGGITLQHFKDLGVYNKIESAGPIR